MARNPARIGNDLTEGSIIKKLLVYALPLLLTNFVQQLYNTVDMAVIGHYVGSIGTVGVSTGGDISSFLTFLGMAFGQAGQVYVAQLSGAKDQKTISRTIGTLLMLMLILSSVCASICIIFSDQLLELLNCPVEAWGQAKSYMIITALGMPFVFEYNAIAGCLRGMGESKRPLLFVSIAATANIFMDLLLVVVIPLEAAGTAIATVAAQFASFAASFYFMYRKRDSFDFDFKLKSFRIYKEQLVVLTKLGLPMACRSALIQLSQMFCISQINNYGLVASATNSVGKKISRLVNIFTNSIDGAAAAMIGQSLGARKIDRAKKVVYTAVAFSAVFCAFECAIAIFVPRMFFRLFVNDPAVIEFGVIYMRVSIIKFLLQIFQGSYQSMVTGSGFAALGLFVGIFDGVVLRIGLSLLFANVLDMGVVGYFYGDSLAHLGAVIPCVIYFYSGKWKTRKLLTQSKGQKAESKA